MKLNVIKIAFLSMALAFLGVTGANAAQNYDFQTQNVYNQADSLKGNVIFVPSGASANVALSSALSSETASVGSLVSAVLTQDFIYNGKVIASEGSTVQGSVVKVKKAGLANRNGQIQVVFNSIVPLYGSPIPINAVFKTSDNTGVLKGGTKMDAAKEYTKDTVVGAGLGAALGTAMGAMSGGSVGKGAIYGTALGGGIGLAKGATERGENVVIPQNASLDIIFTQPITIATPTYEFNY